MGIPRFYRWLSERYPLINENITAEQIPEFDNLYLDMNGIIHNCSHNNTGGLCVKEESQVFVEAFSYICRLVRIIRPQKLLYMAIDGCAPRAKMNQQRSRRFRAANDAREARELALEMGEEVSGPHFDSNCITPGTDFMAKLTTHLRFLICKKIQEDPAWQRFTVVLSGPETPGEGEHKIMDYIRKAKAQPEHDPNTRHCLYGLDADLIMLSLASHEPHFALLREEVVFGRRVTQTTEQRMLIAKDRFQLLHVSLLREYMELEFRPSDAKFAFNLERLIDDFILFCMLVGNDFLPCLPFAEIGESALDDLFRVYKDHLSSTNGSWLTKNCGEVDFLQFARFMKKYGELEEARLQSACDEGEFKLGAQRVVGPREAPDPVDYVVRALEPAPNCELAREQWYEVKFGMDLSKYEGTQSQRKLFQSYLEGLHWVMRYYFRGPSEASWSWYYPYYHAPMAYDLANYDRLACPEIQLEMGEPFHPFQQLMAVLPGSSKALLPSCYQWLFSQGPIKHFYPQKFVVDMDGVKVPWGGMTLIPFIDPLALLDAMKLAMSQGSLSEEEQKRDQFLPARSFQYDMKSGVFVKSTLPRKYGDIQRCPVRINDFEHPELPAGQLFPNSLLRGVTTQEMGFPSLHTQPLTSSFQGGVKVFQFESKSVSLYCHLRPTTAFEPEEHAIQRALRAPAIVDYPCVHRGQIVAVHTAYATYRLDGHVENAAFEHEKRVWNLLQEYRRKGLSVEFDSSALSIDETSAGRLWRGKTGDLSEHELCQQPLVEVKIVQSLQVDARGSTQVTYQDGTELRLWHLVQREQALPSRKRMTLAERFAVGTAVLCIDPQSKAYGLVGRVRRSSEEATEVEAVFCGPPSVERQQSLRQAISQAIEKQQVELKWHDMAEFLKLVELEANVTRQIIGTVMARCADHVREDLGMNLRVDPKGPGDKKPLCLPCYSIKRPQGWFFSDLAVAAVKEYHAKFPQLFQALRTRRDSKKDLEQRTIFPTSSNKDYSSRQLLKYCNSCEWKKLRLAPCEYMALSTSCVQQVAEAVKDASSASEDELVVKGCASLHQAEDPSAKLPEAAAEEFVLGQRGFYLKVQGDVPCGTKGTVIGVYGGAATELEVLLDEECFGATELHGRCPPLRGIQVPAALFRGFERAERGSVEPAMSTNDLASKALKKLLEVSQEEPRASLEPGRALGSKSSNKVPLEQKEHGKNKLPAELKGDASWLGKAKAEMPTGRVGSSPAGEKEAPDQVWRKAFQELLACGK